MASDEVVMHLTKAIRQLAVALERLAEERQVELSAERGAQE